MSTIYLVRHGITAANRENRFAGRTGEGLCNEGVKQMLQVGERLRLENIGAIYCGPARRTEQSAEILGSLLHVPITPLAGLDEINIPHWDGLTKDEIRQRYGAQYPTWLAAPRSFKVPGCETLAEVQQRAVDAVARIKKADTQKRNLLLVSHLIVLRCLVLHFKGLALEEFRRVTIDNGSIIRVSGAEPGGMSVSFL